jgi:hypothetical protein
MTSGGPEDRFAELCATRDIQPKSPSITAPIVASTEYAPANACEQGWFRENRGENNAERARPA